MLAHVLGFDGALGAPLERRDGLYTGRLDGPFAYREGKPMAMRELAEARGHRPGRVLRLLATRSPTCRCCAPSAIRSPSTPTAELARVAREEGWDVMRFERLGRRLKIAAAVGCARAGGRRPDARAARRCR